MNNHSDDHGIVVDLRMQRGEFRLTANFQLADPGVTAIYGASGAGKTSLLRAIAGLSPSHGTIRIGEQIWQDEQTCLAAHQRPAGFVFQEASLFEHLDVRGNLEFGMRRRSATGPMLSFDGIVGLLRLEKLLRRAVNKLSGGEQQRVAIGRALLSCPRLLLMDEPLSSLDAQHKLELLAYLETLQEELQLPMLYVSHSPDEVARLADNLVLMDHGRTLASGPAADMLTRLDLPLSQEKDAAAIMTATCVGYEADYDLSRLSCGTGTLYAPGDLTSYGDQELRIRILARDVSLTLEHQTDTSILNIVPVRVLETVADGTAQCRVRLDCGGHILLARITQKSAAILKLQQNQRLYAQIKSVALL
jgi:molybdate transport system ATP-binding protein